MYGRILGTLAIACLSGCAGTIATPRYEQPSLPEKQSWSIDVAKSRTAEADWWRRFGDPYLDELSASAVTNNVNLELMARRADLAKAQIGSARAALLPVINTGVRSDTTTISGEYDLGTSHKSGVGADMIWELDVWGKTRKGVQGQKSAYRASRADHRAAYLAIVSSVADTYFLIRQADAQIAYQYRTIARARELTRIYSVLVERGLAEKSAVVAQEAELNNAELLLQTLQTNRRKLVNALATLTGIPAGDFELADTSDSATIQPIEVPAGLPSELLHRRPDILAAQERLKQSLALEGQARLAQLPTVGLTSLGGSASYGLSSLLDTWTAGLSGVVQFPVFDPHIRARIPVAEAQVSVAEQEYRVRVMQAFREVEDALVSLDGSRRQQPLLEENRLKRSYVARQETEKLKRGLISKLDVLEAERSLADAEQRLLANRWQILSDTVSLYKAIGGGWGAEDFGT